MPLQAVATTTNRYSLCISEITTKEAQIAMAENPEIDGMGLYLISVDASAPMSSATVLAKFVSEDAAREVAQFFRIHGLLERA